MPFSFCVLASGSSGNCTVVRVGGRGTNDGPERCLLIDGGLSPKQTARRLVPLGIELEDVTDLLLTHFDADHYHRGWNKVAEAGGTTVHCHLRHRALAVASGVPGRGLSLFEEAISLGPATTAHARLLSHNRLGTVGYIIEHDGCRLGFATDVGRASRALQEHFVDLDGLALESNYDRALQLSSARPQFIKDRVMGGHGHLSNEEALQAILGIARRSSLSQLVLLHISRQCNDPVLIKRLYATRAPQLLDRLTITNQYCATPLLSLSSTRSPVRCGEQMSLF